MLFISTLKILLGISSMRMILINKRRGTIKTPGVEAYSDVLWKELSKVPVHELTPALLRLWWLISTAQGSPVL